MQRIHWTLIFIFWVQFVIKKKQNAFTFGGWCYYAFTVTVSYVITRERWFRVYYFQAENFLAFDQIQLDPYRAVFWRRFEATFKLRPVIPIFERYIYIYIYIYSRLFYQREYCIWVRAYLVEDDPKAPFSNSYYTEVLGRALLYSLNCSTLPLILTL